MTHRTMLRGAPLPHALLALALSTVCALAGCASESGGSLYLHPNADLTTYRRVAVLPFENLSSDRHAGERLREILLVELSAEGLFEVVEIGEVNRVLRVQKIDSVSALGPQEVAALGAALSADALVFGTVMDYRERRSGSVTVPDIAISMRLLDVNSGLVVWSVGDARTGVSTWTRLFGFGLRSQSDVARELVRELLSTMY